MAKKSRKNDSILSTLRKETLRGILAVISFILGLFFILSALGLAGIAGEKTFAGLSFLLGIGYFLLPLLSFVLAVSFIRAHEHNIALTQSIGGVLFLISGLGMVGVVANEHGGLIGRMVANPLSALIDVYASFIVLLALFVISLLIIFDIGLNQEYLAKLLSRQKKDGEEKDTKEKEIQAESDVKISLPEEAPESQEKPTPAVALAEKKPLLGKKKKEDELSINLQEYSNKPYTPPPLSILSNDRGKPGVGDIKANANIIKRTLQNFGIAVEMDEVSIGPTVTRYALKPAEGVKLSRIVGLQNELSLALAAHPVRIEAPIPGTSLVGIEVPNSAKTTVGLASLLTASVFTETNKPLMMALGKDIAGIAHAVNLAKMPHMLIAGATGSGKSVTIHALITSLLFRNSPENVKFIMIDPKRVELTLYNKIPHLLTPVITDAKKTILALKWAAKEMERRYDILESESVRDIESYHKNIVAPALKKLPKDGETVDGDVSAPETMPYIVIIIDELADIMQTYPRELEAAIVRLAQMSRAVGIHLILSTQRPSVNVITGLIKANVPARIALQVSSQIDSRTILDASGAEKLLGAGDMLFMSGEMSKPRRVQSAFISESEVKKVAKYLADSYADAIPNEIDFTSSESKNALFESSLEDDVDDDLYEEAREIVIEAGKASTSYIQRKLRVGYSRAARLIDMLEERGVIGPQDGSKPREVLTKAPEALNEETG